MSLVSCVFHTAHLCEWKQVYCGRSSSYDAKDQLWWGYFRFFSLSLFVLQEQIEKKMWWIVIMKAMSNEGKLQFRKWNQKTKQSDWIERKFNISLSIQNMKLKKKQNWFESTEREMSNIKGVKCFVCHKVPHRRKHAFSCCIYKSR